ncbi:carboxyl-terminal processing protease [Marinobacterium halophilum]|uniref:Carboxyl-terminal processing protease n=1 Tax=Marinobacterium halophilum TaxID=267374 RepID=A0A2P8EWH2_9GAMM|nr:S41 family peptidase [Marinobacterium halophilum]PSL13829.1 carboxyl-terminal processing protease [Marinobacterium halophilum]
MKLFSRTPLAVALLSCTLSLPYAAMAEDMADNQNTLPLTELRMFADVFDRIKQAYVEPVDDRQLLEDAIRGMLAGLDPHSAYLEPEAFESLQVHTRGEFGGLGIEVGLEDGFIRVIAPIDDTPAQRAGVRAGDLIIKLDDTPVQGLDLNEAVDMMRGAVGTPIRLTIMRDGRDQPLELEILRDVIKVHSVRHELLETGYGYLRISQFQAHTGDDLISAINTLQENGPLKGLVLDLRNNPGGVLQAAVEVSNAFLDEGLIVYTEGRLPNSELRFNASPETVAADIPLIVLINGGSASAAEIVAGALQDHQRAVLMGTDSFGKGSVQTVLPLGEDRAIKLTTARYYTPSGRSIQAQGIRPDLRVDDATLTPVDAGERIKERDLAGHLENGTEEADPAQGGGSERTARDFQLYEALNLLKAMQVLQRTSPAT